MPHITFIHGISNKPAESQLKKIWLEALAADALGNDDGIDLGTAGVTTSMIYWADVLYDKPEEILHESVSNLEHVEDVAQKTGDPDMSWRDHIGGEEKRLVDELSRKWSFDMLVDDDFVPSPDSSGKQLERILLPWFVKRRLMKWLLRDVHHYLFNYRYSPGNGRSYQVQEEIRDRVVRMLTGINTDKHIVVAHSMGTVIMYDCLLRVKECPEIDAFMTIGSPLGIDEIQDKMAPEWSRSNGFPSKIKGQWVNVFDSLDPVVGLDGFISNDYMKNGDEVIHVIHEQNAGAWRHNITQYLSRPMLRAALTKMLDV